ncbi:Endonuclease, partial [Candidatus Methanophagaceae archaeon]
MKREKLMPVWAKILILIGILAMVFLSGCCKGPQPPSVCYDHSLRLLTYNLAMLATGDSNEDIYLMDDEKRAGIIADHVLKEEHDIVVFQEVFHDDGKDVLANKLGGTYPHYIYKLDAHDLDQDSGLMLFSRYPFAPLPKDTFKANDVTATSSSAPCNWIWKDVAFLEFDDCQGYDCWANKGVGLVRIEVPCTGRYVNVAFTHLQASYGADSPVEAELAVAIRRNQLLDIQKVIKGTLTNKQLEREQIYLMGDLNINGNLFNLEPLAGSGKSEWSERFDSGGFFATVLKDSWAFQTSPDDPGQTASGGFPFFPDGEKDGERLDYIFYSPSANFAPVGIHDQPYCVQHLSKAWELAEDNGNHHYTDHFAVKADINLQAPYCNPLEAYAVNPQPNENVNGIITYPGSMQWYRIDESGSYSIYISGVVEGDVMFHVYESDDLSRPIGNYHGVVTEWGLKFVMPEAPFYIRVFASDRFWQGDYYIQFHKHEGASPEDSITLKPARPETRKMPPTPMNPENAVWFDFHTDVSENGESPYLQFLLNYSSSKMFTFELLDSIEKVISNSWEINESLTSGGFHALMNRTDLSKGKYYLKILPEITNPSGKEYSIEWRTTLTYFLPRNLKCIIPDDNFGDDTIWALMQVDPAAGGYSAYDLGDFDEESLKGVSGSMGGVRKYVQNTWVLLYEQDCELDIG